MTDRPQYGTWIRPKAIVAFGVLTTFSFALAMLSFWSRWALVFLVPAALFGWILMVIGLTSHRFSDRGGGYQHRIHRLLVERASGTTVLDIGCGNGALSIELAKVHADRHVTGLDFWGRDWQYSQAACDRNAEIEGVAERCSFVQGSASRLPFDDEQFDCVVSCLCFHEVRDVQDKTASVSEALRVLRRGGRFVFFDLFSDPKAFPNNDLLSGRVREKGGEIEEDRPCSELLVLPFPLKGKKVLGYARLISGARTK
ncbi:MAG: methyltransferase domain-containing protein [Chloroflexi bacterium]|nr:methyltransferase domain-containing protein [Chloroflexota bacterium]